MDWSIFSDVRFFVIQCDEKHLIDKLKSSGAVQHPLLSESVRFAISNDPSPTEVGEAEELYAVPVVTTSWVNLSAEAGQFLPYKPFHPDFKRLFSHLTFTLCELSLKDRFSLWSVLTIHGAKVQHFLDGNVTHVICGRASGKFYNICKGESNDIHPALVSPDWVVDSLAKKELLHCDSYHPDLLKRPPSPRKPVPKPQVSLPSVSDSTLHPTGKGPQESHPAVLMPTPLTQAARSVHPTPGIQPQMALKQTGVHAPPNTGASIALSAPGTNLRAATGISVQDICMKSAENRPPYGSVHPEKPARGAHSRSGTGRGGGVRRGAAHDQQRIQQQLSKSTTLGQPRCVAAQGSVQCFPTAYPFAPSTQRFVATVHGILDPNANTVGMLSVPGTNLLSGLDSISPMPNQSSHGTLLVGGLHGQHQGVHSSSIVASGPPTTSGGGGGGGHHGKTSKSKSSKHSQEQNLNEEEKDAIVIQYVKNILNSQNKSIRDNSQGKSSASSSSSELGSGGVPSALGSSIPAHGANIHTGMGQGAQVCIMGGSNMTAIPAPSTPRKPKSPRSPGRAALSGGAKSSPKSPKGGKATAMNKLLSSPQQQQQHQQGSSIMMAGGPGSVSVPSVFFAGNLPHFAGRQPNNNVPSLSIQQLQRPASVQHFITAGSLPNQQQHLVSAAPAYIVQRHPAGQLLASVSRQVPQQPQVHTQVAIGQNCAAAACASQIPQPIPQRQFAQVQSPQTTLYVRTAQPSYQSESGELITDSTTSGTDLSTEIASVLVTTNPGAQLGRAQQQQNSAYQHAQTQSQVQQQHTAQQVLLQSSPSSAQLIQLRASHIPHPAAQQQHSQLAAVGGGGSSCNLTQVSGIGLAGRVQQQQQHSQQVSNLVSAHPVAVHSATNAQYNASKPGSHAQLHAADRASPIISRSPQTPQPYLTHSQQQSSHNHSQQYITSQQPKMHLTVPAGQQYHSVQGYLQAQSQPQQIIFQSPTGQKLIAHHHQPATAAAPRVTVAQPSLSPGGVLLRSVGPHSVGTGTAATVCSIHPMQSHMMSFSANGPSNPPTQLVNGSTAVRGNVLYQTNHASALGPGVMQQMSHAAGQHTQPYGHVGKQNQLPMQPSSLRPTPSSPGGNTLCTNPNLSSYHPGPAAGPNSLTPNHISPQSRGSAVRPGYPTGQHTGKPIHSRVTHVGGTTPPQQTPTRHGHCHPIAAPAPPAPIPPIVPLPPTYYGHEGTPKPTRPEECLIGCVFLLLGYRAAGESKRALWRRIIRSYGAEVVLAYDPTRVTHLIIDCQLEEPNIVTQALRDRVRIVTIFWVNDVLAKGRMLPPYEIQHLPSPFSPDITFSFIKSQIVSLTGFDGKDRLKVEFLIRQLGATYTDYLEPLNTLLVCKRPEGKKYEMAQQWSIPCVNVRWLQDIYFGDLMSLALDLSHKYLSFEPSDVTTALDRCTPRVQDLMIGWQVPIRLNHDAWTRLNKLSKDFAIEERERKRKLEMEAANHPKPKRLKSSLSPLSDNDVKLVAHCRTRLEMLTNELKEQSMLRATLKERLEHMTFTEDFCPAQNLEVLSLVTGGSLPLRAQDEEETRQSCSAVLSDSSQEPMDPQASLKTEYSAPAPHHSSQDTTFAIPPETAVIFKEADELSLCIPLETYTDQNAMLKTELLRSPTPTVAHSSSHIPTSIASEQVVSPDRTKEHILSTSDLTCTHLSIKPEECHEPTESEDFAFTRSIYPAVPHSPSSPEHIHPSRPESMPSLARLTEPIKRKRFASGDIDHLDVKRRTTHDTAAQRSDLEASLRHSADRFESITVAPVHQPESAPDVELVLESPHLERTVNSGSTKQSQLSKQVINTSVRITFTAIDYESRLSLMELCMQLPDCELVESAADATHLVCNRLLRTPKTYMAIAMGLYLVTPKWIQASVVRGVWLDETPWLLSDPEAEMQLGVQLSESMLRSRRRRMLGPQAGLFAGLEFWLSPGACHREVCIMLIKACGGTLRHKRPTQKMALLPRPRQLIICHEDDSHVANYLMRIKTGNKAVHHEEFVLSGVLRQELDYESYQIQYVNTLQTNLRAAVAAAEASLANSCSFPMSCVVTTSVPVKSERSLSRGSVNSTTRLASVESRIASEAGLPSDSASVHYQPSRCSRPLAGQSKPKVNSYSVSHPHTMLVESPARSVVNKSPSNRPLATSGLHHLLNDSLDDVPMHPSFYSLPCQPQTSRELMPMRERDNSDANLHNAMKRLTDASDLTHLMSTVPSSAYGMSAAAAVPVSSITPYRVPANSVSPISYELPGSVSSVSLESQRDIVAPRLKSSSVVTTGVASSHQNVHFTQPHRQVTALTAMIVAAESGSSDLSVSVTPTSSDVSSFVLPKSGGFRGQTTSTLSGSSALNARSAAADAHAVATATAAAANALIHSERKVGVGIAELGAPPRGTRSPRTSHATGLFATDFGDVKHQRAASVPPTSPVLTGFTSVSSLDGVKNLITNQLNFQLPGLTSAIPNYINPSLPTLSTECSTTASFSLPIEGGPMSHHTSIPNLSVDDLLLNEQPHFTHETAISCGVSVDHSQSFFGSSLTAESNFNPPLLAGNTDPHSYQGPSPLSQSSVVFTSYQIRATPPVCEFSSSVANHVSNASSAESSQTGNN
ncbi:unnamed protein product [Dicrocoelium dendriticum]|nr:unnamed protein product [Dicrocoelium dendriticum]